MGESHLIEGMLQQAREGRAQSAGVAAIFRGKRRKAKRIEVNQRVADAKRAAGGVQVGDLARRRAGQRDDVKLSEENVAVADRRDRARW